MDTLGVNTIEAVADRGYFKIEDIAACEKAGITAYVSKPIRGRAVAEGFFSREQLRYDPDKDIYLCPADQVLSPRHYGKSCDNVKIDYVNRDACKACSLCERCTRSFRRVSHLENEGALDRMAECLAARPDILDRRRKSVEHPFGTIKQWMDQGVPDAAPGKRSRRGQPDGAGLKYQKGAITLVSVAGLIAPVRA